MRPLELSKEQRDKLLEMCKELFPEYKLIELTEADLGLGGGPHIVGTPYCGDGFDCYIGFSNMDVPRDDYTCIHWFEFCMTHLVSKISAKLDDQLEDDTPDSKHMNIVITARDWVGEMYLKIMDSWNKSVHPVEYLYEQFKRIKE